MTLPNFPTVNPGDVIRSGLMNLIITTLADLDTRLSKLESTGPAVKPHIDDYSPKVNLREGDDVTISGKNLYAGGNNLVFIDRGTGSAIQISAFKTFSDSLLVFRMPGVFAQSIGTPISIRVSSPTQGSDAVSVIVYPAQVTIPTGDIRIQLAAPPNTTFSAPGTYPLTYTLNANTTLSDTYDLIPQVDGPGWTVNIVDSSGAVVQNPSVVIAAAASASQPTIKKGSLQLTIPNGATGSANLTLEVKSRLNPKDLDKTSPKAVIPVNGQVLLSEGIGVSPTPQPSQVDADGNLLVPIGGTGLTLMFLVTVTTPGIYTLATRFDNDPGTWSVDVGQQVAIPSANVAKPVSVTLKASTGPSISNFYLKVTSPDGTQVTEVFYPVRTK